MLQNKGKVIYIHFKSNGETNFQLDVQRITSKIAHAGEIAPGIPVFHGTSHVIICTLKKSLIICVSPG